MEIQTCHDLITYFDFKKKKNFYLLDFFFSSLVLKIIISTSKKVPCFFFSTVTCQFVLCMALLWSDSLDV